MPESPIALVHGPGWPVAGVEQVEELLAGFAARSDAAVGILLVPQTDTLKSVDGARLVTGTLDRTGYRAVLSPIAVRPDLLPPALRGSAGPEASAGPGGSAGALRDAAALLRDAVAAGCTIAEVPA